MLILAKKSIINHIVQASNEVRSIVGSGDVAKLYRLSLDSESSICS